MWSEGINILYYTVDYNMSEVIYSWSIVFNCGDNKTHRIDCWITV